MLSRFFSLERTTLVKSLTHYAGLLSKWMLSRFFSLKSLTHYAGLLSKILSIQPLVNIVNTTTGVNMERSLTVVDFFELLLQSFSVDVNSTRSWYRKLQQGLDIENLLFLLVICNFLHLGWFVSYHICLVCLSSKLAALWSSTRSS